jgi:OTU-like cysteine protease
MQGGGGGHRDNSSEADYEANDGTAEIRLPRSSRRDEQHQQEDEDEEFNGDDPASASAFPYENEPPPPSAQVRIIGPATKGGGGAAIVLATHNNCSSSYASSAAMMASSSAPPRNVQGGMHPGKRGGAQQGSANYGTSFDEDDEDVRDNDGADEMEEAFVKGLKSRGLNVVEQEGDGNCLFRAVALQVYGDAEAHPDVRGLVCDFMAKDPAHFGQFVDGETFDAYVARKRRDGVHGNNPELQAVCELFNRPIEVYTPESGHLKPINTFQDQYKTGDIPIRLSYHDGNHYNAVIDPLEPTAGLGLGLPGLRPGLADKLQLSRAKAESDAVQDEAELRRAVQESAGEYGRTAADDLQRALKESSFSMDHVRALWKLGVLGFVPCILHATHANACARFSFDLQMYQDKALVLSDLDATNYELEQTALEDSMLAFAAEQGRKQRARIFAGSMGGSGTPASTAAASSRSSSRPRRGRDDDAFFYGSSDGPLVATPHASLVPAAASSTTAPTAAAAASSSVLASPPAAQSPPRFSAEAARAESGGGGGGGGDGFGALLDAMEYPETVQELVMNGFELSHVLRAYELFGDSFEDLLSLLLSQQRQQQS